jgi:hypothetical protein
VADGDPGQTVQGFVVVHLLAAEDTAVAVVRILAHAHVGDDVKIRILCLDGPDSLLDNALLRPGGGAAAVLLRRQAEEDGVGYAVGQTFLHSLTHAVQAVVVLARQAGDGTHAGQGLVHKDRVDQGVRAEPGLPAQAADLLRPPETAGAVDKLHVIFLRLSG